MTITIKVENTENNFTSVLEAIRFLANTDVQDPDRVDQSQKNIDAYNASINNENEIYSLDQAKQIL